MKSHVPGPAFRISDGWITCVFQKIPEFSYAYPPFSSPSCPSPSPFSFSVTTVQQLPLYLCTYSWQCNGHIPVEMINDDPANASPLPPF